MSGPLSKRQQARNEKVLQDLVRNAAGNNTCADCYAQNPAWASWSLGIFLCMRCAAIHRKLGTHISKVKSLSMDSWTSEQVENMKKVGNIASNKSYNPQNKRPPVPIDADEADSAMEKFIRQKYINNGLVPARRHNTGSSESDETPPPLPPKPVSRFGFRSSSSIFALGSKAKKQAAAREPPSPRDLSRFSPRRSKSSQIFSATVRYDGGDDTERKLAKLRDMGFSDHQRNALVLKGVHGDLEQTIEALIRLGEGPRRPSHSLTSPSESTLPSTRSLTPAKSSSFGLDRPASTSSNPFDMLDMPPAQPQSSQSTGTLQNKNPYLATNPFGMPAQHAGASLDQAFQNLALAPSQPLFPHHTGGIPSPQQQQGLQPMYQQPTTYPIPSAAQQPNFGSVLFNNNQASPPPLQPGYNPFFTDQQTQQSLKVNTAGLPGSFGSNPFTRSPTRIQTPLLTQIPEQSQQNFYTPAPQQQPQPQPQPQVQPQLQLQLPPQTNNPFLGQTMFVSQQATQLPQRPDNASIMALYNYPQLATNPFQAQTQQRNAAQTNPLDRMQGSHNVTEVQQRLAPISPPPGSRNPFLAQGVTPPTEKPAMQLSLIDVAPNKYNASRDSILAHGLEWSNGRHSPDAFASLSARDMR